MPHLKALILLPVISFSLAEDAVVDIHLILT